MDELTRDVERARESVAEPWNDLRAERLLRDVEARVAEPPVRSRRWIVAGALAGALALGIGVAVLLGRTPGPAPHPAVPQPRALAPEDAPPKRSAPPSQRPAPPPRVTTRPSQGAQVRVLRDTPDALAMRVDTGRVDVQLALTDERTVTVAAGPVRIDVQARSFAVERTEQRVGVWVFDGVLEVHTADGVRTVTAGQQAWFGDAPADKSPAAAAPEPHADWRVLAADGEFEQSYALLAKARGPLSAADLIRAADVARLTGHSTEAVEYLDTLIADHYDDPRTPLGAFTMGRIYLYELGRPRDAAGAFALARELAPSSSVAEDALAREVEAWSRAGDEDEARTAAQQYLERYPDGHWTDKVKRYGAPPQ